MLCPDGHRRHILPQGAYKRQARRPVAGNDNRTPDRRRTETPHVATYIDLNLHVVNLRRNSAGGTVAGNMNYDKTASTVSMDFPYNQDSDGFLALRMWGIYTNPVVFEIIKLDGKQLVMRSPASIVTCRRF